MAKRRKNKKVSVHHVKVAIPSGRCPISLEGTDEASIIVWMDRLRALQPCGYELQPSAFRYWASHTYGVFSQECKQVRSIIDKLTQPK